MGLSPGRSYLLYRAGVATLLGFCCFLGRFRSAPLTINLMVSNQPTMAKLQGRVSAYSDGTLFNQFAICCDVGRSINFLDRLTGWIQHGAAAGKAAKAAVDFYYRVVDYPKYGRVAIPLPTISMARTARQSWRTDRACSRRKQPFICLALLLEFSQYSAGII